MKELGYALVAAGICYLLYAFNMDVSVTVPVTAGPYGTTYGGNQIANADLMSQRQNHLIVACLITAVGAAMAIFGHRSEDETAEQGTRKSPKKVGKFEGEHDLSNDAYRLWLASAYSIERNEVFDRFVIGDTTFDDLDAALAHADGLETQKANDAVEAEAQRLKAIEDREAERAIAAEEAEAEWQANKPKMYAGFAILLAILVGLFFMVRETDEEREARLAAAAEAEIALIENINEKFGITLPDDFTDVKELKNEDNSYDFYCEDRQDGDIIEFSTSKSEKEVKDIFAETLGEGKAKYDFGDYEDWNWEKGSKSYYFTTIGGGMNLCMVTEN